MTIWSIIQAAIDVPEGAKEPIYLTAVLAAFKAWDHFKGRHRDRKLGTKLDQMAEDVRKVKWHLEGPDGDGGLLKDHEELTLRVDVISRHLPPDDTLPRSRRR